MGKVILHEHPDPEAQALERARAFNALSVEEKMKRLVALNNLVVLMNGGKPIKQPQGKGLVLHKLKKD